MAPMAPAMAPAMAPSVRVAPPRLVSDVDLLLLGLVAVHQRQHGREEEEDGVHDAKGKARLQHAARLVDVDVERVERGVAEDAEADGRRRPGRDVDAVKVLDEAQIVHAGYEGADEAEIDEADELRVRLAAMVREEREQRPSESEDRHDEEDEDVVGRQHVVVVIALDEVGEHAHQRYLDSGFVSSSLRQSKDAGEGGSDGPA
jgi:hypothetical protein